MFYGSSRRCGSGRLSVSRWAAPVPVTPATLREVFGITWVVGVCGSSHFDMALDCGAGGSVKGQHLAGALLLVLGDPDAEVPAFARRREVLARYPGSGFMRVAVFGPAPELIADAVVQLDKGPLGRSMSIVVGPTLQNGIEFAKERLLAEAQAGLNAEPDFVPQALDVALGGKGQEFIPQFAHRVPQKVEALRDGGDDGLLL